MKQNTLVRASAVFAAIAMLPTFGCNSNNATTNMLKSITGAVTTDSNGDLIANVSADLSTSQYGLAELNVPVVDPNTHVEYGTVSITPTVCSSATCVNGGTLTLSLNITAISGVDSVSTELPNNTAFPITFGSSTTKLVAVSIGNSGAKLYVAIGGGTYFVGAAIPFAGLNGAGQYTPGLDVFGTVVTNDVTSYIGYFAGTGNEQTGVGIFADLSKLVPATAPAVESVHAMELSAKPANSTPAIQTSLKPSTGSEQDQQNFFYHLWKHGQSHPVLSYQ